MAPAIAVQREEQTAEQTSCLDHLPRCIILRPPVRRRSKAGIEVKRRKILSHQHVRVLWAILALAAGLILLSPQAAWSQANLATFYGTVNDPSGASIPGATVTLTNQNTQAVMTKSTGANGGFAFTFIPVGTYTLSISASGLRPLVRADMALTAGQQLQETFEMTLGPVTETVTIEGELTQI